jgi:hypothetical protein
METGRGGSRRKSSTQDYYFHCSPLPSAEEFVDEVRR